MQESGKDPTPQRQCPTTDLPALCQELEMHRANLEMQNAELRRTQEELRASEEQSRDLYEFAPAGYFLLDREGSIRQANLTGSALLHVERAYLIARRFQSFVAPASMPVFRAFLARLAESEEKEACELELRSPGLKNPLWVVAEGRPQRDAGYRVALTDITGRILAESSLKENEERFRTVIENSQDGILLADVRGLILEWNAGMEQITGLSREIVVGAPLRNVMYMFADLREGLHKPDWTRIVRAFRSPTTPLSPDLEEFTLTRPDGSRRTVQARIFRIPVQDGFRTGCIVRDVTERRRFEESLREHEAILLSIFRAAPVGIGLVADRILLQVNDTLCTMLGYAPEDLIGRSARILYPDDAEFEFVGKKKYRQINELNVGTVETRFQRKDGSIRNILLSSTPLDPRDMSKGVTFTALDITERKRAEKEREYLLEQVEQERNKLRTLVNSIADEVWHLDADHTIVLLNPAATMGLGLAGEESHPFGEILDTLEILNPDGSQRPQGEAPLFRSLRGEVLSGEEIVRHRITGELRYRRYHSAPVRDASGKILGAVAVVSDITERKRTEEALQRHTEDLARLNRELESAHREANLYLDILTHDIGNTENVSNLYTELLADTRDGEAAAYVEKLQRSVRKSIEILGIVSKIRRIHSGPPEIRPTDLDAVIREEIAHFPEDVIRYRGSPVPVLADDLLSEVFANLIGNAIKHGGPDVAITIRTEEEDGQVLVSVEDTGPGVPDEDKEAIFHRYEQKKRGVGEGLGLYLVQILVERYGGRVWVEDRVSGHAEEGAAFLFTLRKAQDA